MAAIYVPCATVVPNAAITDSVVVIVAILFDISLILSIVDVLKYEAEKHIKWKWVAIISIALHILRSF